MPGVKVGGVEFAQLAYNVTDAAKLLGVSRMTMGTLIAEHGLRTKKLGSLRMIPAAELARLLDEVPPDATA